MNQELTRINEINFFNELGSIDVFRRKFIFAEEFFNEILIHYNEEKRQQLYQFNEEILNNLFYLTDTNARRAYLNRLMLITESTEGTIIHDKDLILSGKNTTVKLLPLYPNEHPYQAPKEQLESFYNACIEKITRLKQTLQYYLKAETEQTPAAITPSSESKIPWSGTPQEFGAIKGKEIEQGFIPKIKDLKNTVRILYNHYMIFDTDGKEVTFDYLYKCFIERKKQYYPHEFIMPKSDNYGKV